MQSNDAELLEVWRGGDNDAGNELVRRHFMSVYRFFANKVNEDVDDLIQRTFLACVEGRDRVREDASLRPYILGIARNQLLMHLRRRDRQERPFLPDEMTIAELTGSPSRVMADRDDEKLLLAALREIPLDLQTIVELYYWEELSVTQMAVILDIPAGTVKSRLFRARDALRIQLANMSAPDNIRKTTADGFDVWARGLQNSLFSDAETSQDRTDG